MQMQTATADLPTPIDDRSLIAACDVLVLRALELVGKRVVRMDRSRYGRMGDRPFYEAHLLWQPDSVQLDRALESAWDLVPHVVSVHGRPHLSPVEIRLVLDRYVRELIKATRGHDVTELAYRLGAYT
jgi:hypothetical protein